MWSLFFLGAAQSQSFTSPFQIAGQGEAESEPETTVDLISEYPTFVPGDQLLLGVVVTMKPHWHSYWKNPGDSGMPTTVKWEVPEGFEVGEIQWPTPERFLLERLVSYGYEGEFTLLMTLQTRENFPVGETVDIKGKVSWLECKDVCLPGSGTISLQLKSAESTGEVNARIEQAAERMPRFEDWPTTVESTDTETTLRIQVPEDAGSFAHFFPYEEGGWILEPEPELVRDGSSLEIRLVRNGTASDAPGPPAGVLVDEEGGGVDIRPMETQTPAGNPAMEEEKPKGIFYYLGFAFLAGIGMNLLPCIFPVLGLKISGFIEQAQGDQASVRKHALVFGAGVVISLWILGAIVGLLGAAWGAQFQDPRVVIGMLLILTFFTMNLFGVFEMGNSLTTVGGGLSRKQGYAGSFFQGVLLTVIGTPCTGPVLAVVIVWMFTQPLWIGFLAFTLMGVGMALPYVALAFSPKLIEKLPRPGNWMITFKRASAFMIVLFLWVLLYVLRGQISAEGTVQVVGAMLLVCFAAWVLGTWAAPGRSKRSETLAKVMCVLLLALSGYLAFTYHEPVAERTEALNARIESGGPIRWSDVTPDLAKRLVEEGVPVHYRPYSPELVEELREQGHRVFVDFTADWCTICKINKFNALHKENVMKAFEEHNVVTLRADWTARDEVIAEVLADYGRRGVPVYQLFDATPGTRATLLPEKLYPDTIFEALDKHL
ncbi:MAG: protein-disulfide reductase DsbD domain-containing protein [Kiritimatiellia bacterium]